MKLNYKKTMLIGLAFMSICSFWQMYNPTMPLILKYSFKLDEVSQGVIMALDNILAVFMLPFFGALSDKHKSTLGKRMPFIVGGTAIASIFCALIPIAEASKSLVFFIATTLLLLIAMGIYRSPAVSLMSDLTEKPLRSKANAIINLMGALGSVFTIILLKTLSFRTPEGHENFSFIYFSVSIFMIVSITVLYFSIKENQKPLDLEKEEEANESDNIPGGFKSLGREEKRSLIFILCSIFLWFFGYNAVETNFTKYAAHMWKSDIGAAATCLLIASIGGIISFLPFGFLGTKIGRKNTIRIGIVMLSTCYLIAGALKEFSFIYYILFIFVGSSWAAINVNSLPMVVEICKAKDIGKFTGYYYTFSMASQIITPIFCGFLLEKIGYSILMPYGAIAVALSFITISFSKLGDSKKV